MCVCVYVCVAFGFGNVAISAAEAVQNVFFAILLLNLRNFADTEVVNRKLCCSGKHTLIENGLNPTHILPSRINSRK